MAKTESIGWIDLADTRLEEQPAPPCRKRNQVDPEKRNRRTRRANTTAQNV